MLAEGKSLEIWEFGEPRPISAHVRDLVGRSSKALSRTGTRVYLVKRKAAIVIWCALPGSR